MGTKAPRPMSPHLTIWRWGPHMLASILHRVTGSGLTLIGLPLLTWWLVAISEGDEAYARFTGLVTHPVGLVVLVGLTWAFFQKAIGGIRHLVMDTGAHFEIGRNKKGAVAAMIVPLLLTGAFWAYMLVGRGA
jgi:succinate dehydrogenase / fumarate reductase, cytochrome b subunit